MLISAPSSPRELCDLFLLYRESAGLDALLDCIDFSAASPWQLYYSVFGTNPKSTNDVIRTPGYSARLAFMSMLSGNAFRAKIVRLILESYPEKKRLFFIHVPKCAGSDLTTNLVRRQTSVDSKMQFPHWMSLEALFLALAEIAVSTKLSGSIFCHGHVSLVDYANASVIRPTDHVFSIIREPLDLSVSQVNYVLTRLSVDKARGKWAPDTKDWLDKLEMEDWPSDLAGETLRSLYKKVLFHTHMVRPNTICYWLGRGTAESAIDNVVMHNVELTNTEHYKTWLDRVWNVKSETRQNESHKYITVDEIDEEDISYIRNITSEDIKFYGIVMDALAKRNRSSVFGSDLAGFI
jgi:hypothetical protein